MCKLTVIMLMLQFYELLGFVPHDAPFLRLVCVCAAAPEEKCTKSVNDEIARKGRETMELISAKLSSVFLCATLLNSGMRHSL